MHDEHNANTACTYRDKHDTGHGSTW